jgi:tRNA (guanine37-N1)-methyltransferase
MAAQFSTSQHLVFACGRYEGIDDRVRQHYETAIIAFTKFPLVTMFWWGEVATLVMIEAITRLISRSIGQSRIISGRITQ